MTASIASQLWDFIEHNASLSIEEVKQKILHEFSYGQEECIQILPDIYKRVHKHLKHGKQ